MKIVIVDGRHEADYIISMYNNKKNDLIVINQDEDVCRYLSNQNNIPVMRGNPTRMSDLHLAGAENADLFIALAESDHENYVACKLAKKIFGAKRCIATVINPKNVDAFRSLGIDSVMSATYLLGEQVRNAATIENLIRTLSLENDEIVITEYKITPDLYVCDQTLKDIKISDIASVSSIVRNGKGIIPNGNTKLLNNDKVLVVTTHNSKDRVMKFFQRKK